MLKITKIVAFLTLFMVALVACGDNVGASTTAQQKVVVTVKGFRHAGSYPGLAAPPQDPLFTDRRQVYGVVTMEVTVPVDASITEQKRKLLDSLTKQSVVTEYPKGSPQYSRLDNVVGHTMKAVQDGDRWKVTGDLVYLVFYEPDSQIIDWDDVIQGEDHTIQVYYPKS